MNLFTELKRRNVFRVAIFYIVSAWLLLQIVDLIFEVLLVPDWTLRFIFGLLVAAFPFVLFFAWAYEVTPEGIRRESDLDRSASSTRRTGRKLDIAVIVVVLAGIAVALSNRWLPSKQAVETEPASYEGINSTSRPVLGERSDQVSIAVLPFEDMSAEGDQAYFGDGIAEELLNALVRIEGLKVAGRTSSFAFKDTNTDLTTIGNKLGVAHILEGSVRKAGNRVRVTAQLVKAEDGFHLWSETYDRTLNDIFAIQDEITGEIVAALKENLPGLQSEAVDTTGTDSVEAYNALLQGRYLLHQRGRENVLRAQELLQQAVEIDPDFAEAHAQLARSLSVGWGVNDPERALEAANRALELAPDSPIALMAYGGAEYRRGKIPEAISALERSLAIQPENPEAMHVLAGLLVDYEADIETAIALERRARTIDPTGVIYPLWLGMYELGAGQVETALGIFEEARELDPRMAGWLAFALAITGDVEAAREMELPADDAQFASLLETLNDALEGRHDQASTRILALEPSLQREDNAYAALVLLVAGDIASANRVMRASPDSVMLSRWRLIFGYLPEIDIHATAYPEIMKSRGMPMFVYPENPPGRDD